MVMMMVMMMMTDDNMMMLMMIFVSHCLSSLNSEHVVVMILMIIVLTMLINLPADTLASGSLVASQGSHLAAPPSPPRPRSPTASHAPCSHLLLPPISSHRPPTFQSFPPFATGSRLVVPESGSNPVSHETCSPENFIVNELF